MYLFSARGSMLEAFSIKCNPAALICIIDAAFTSSNMLVSSFVVILRGSVLPNNKDFSSPLMCVTSGFCSKALSSVAPNTCLGFALGTIAITLPFAPAAKLLEIISNAPGLRILSFHPPKRKSFAGFPLLKPVFPKIDIKAFLSGSLRGSFPSKSKKSNAGVLSRTLKLLLFFNPGLLIISPVDAPLGIIAPL